MLQSQQLTCCSSARFCSVTAPLAKLCHVQLSGAATIMPYHHAPRCWRKLVQAQAAAVAVAERDQGPSTSGRQDGCMLPARSFASRKNLHDAGGRLMLKSLTFPQLQEWCVSIGEPPARALHLWRWLYSDSGGLIRQLEDALGAQNGFSQRFVDKANAVATISGGLDLVSVSRARDGTRKLVFKLTCGESAAGMVETVLIPVVREQGGKERLTICISSQVGCAMNCQFCYTGRMGLLGQLSSAQIVEQVVEARRFLVKEGDTTPISNVVFMGMGEPLNNLEAVLAATEIMCEHMGLHLSHNKVTVSTVGLIPEIREFMSRSRVQLALSLHATTDEVRDWIVPVNRRSGLAGLMAELQLHFGQGSPSGQKLFIEYVMLREVNDTDADARRLVDLTRGLLCKVNLITFNSHEGTRFLPSSMERALEFRSILIQAGMVCTIRCSRGDDEMAACGQLGNPRLSSKNAPMLEPPPRFMELMSQRNST